MSVQVRQAVLTDYSCFARVAREVHEHHVAAVPSVFRSVDIAFSEERYAELVSDENATMLVADCDGDIVGYAVLVLRHTARDIFVPRTIGFVENFGVAKSHRRRGVGSLLMSACAAHAKERGATSLELDCWEANREAARFYASVGMHVMRRWLSMDL